MTATVIIVGYNPSNRIDDTIIYPCPPPDPPRFGVVACSPKCIVTSVAVTYPDLAAPSDAARSTLRFANSPQAKPAECYVLTFGDIDDAKDWLTHAVPVAQLVGKTVLLLDEPAPAT